MASLLSWLGGNKQPQAAVPTYTNANQQNHNVPQAVAPPQHPSFLQRATNDVGNVAKQGFNLATFGQGNHLAGLEQKAFRNAPGAINAGIQHLPSPVIRPVANFVNKSLVTPLMQTGVHSAQLAQGQNPYHGTNEQIAGQLGTDALNLSTVLGGGKVAKGFVGAEKALPFAAKVIKGVKTGAKVGAGYGGAQGLTQGLQQGQNVPQLLKSTGTGVVAGGTIGGLTGGAVPVIGAGIGKGAELVQPKFNGLRAKQIIMDTQKLDTLNNAKQILKTGKAPAEARNAVNQGLHQIKDEHGLDFLSGSPNARSQRISQYLEQNSEAIPQLQARPQMLSHAGGGFGTENIGNPKTSSSKGSIPNPADVPPTVPPTTKLVKASPESTPVSLPQVTKKAKSVSLPNSTPPARGLTKGIQGSNEFTPTLQKSVTSSYEPFTNKAATASTEDFMKQPHAEAFKQVMQTLTDQQGKHIPGASGNLGVKFGKQEVSNAGALMKTLDQKGDHAGAQAIHDALATKLTNAGQTAQAASLIYNRTPAGLANMARKTLSDAKVKITPELQKKMDAGLQKIKNTEDGTRPNQYARKQYDKLVGSHLPTSAGTKALSLYKTGILSSPKTAVKVAMAGVPNMLLENTADLAAAPVDRLVSMFTGKRAVTAPGIKSTVAGAKALPKAFKDAGIRFKDDIVMPGSSGLGNAELSGTNARPHGANFGIAKGGGHTKLDNLTGGFSSKMLNGYTSSIGRVHGAFQTIPYETRYAQSLTQSAIAAAKTQGLKGTEKNKFIANFVANPPKAAHEIADQSAQYATSQQKTALGQAASGIQHTLPGGQIIAPITRIPGAVATQVLNYSPLGLAKTAGSAILDKRAGNAFDQQAFSRGIGRSLVGSGLLAGGAALAAKGRVSGEYPKDKATQQLWVSANIPANSVYVGGKAYPGEPWKNTGGSWQQIGSPGGAAAQATLTGGATLDGYKKGGVVGAALQGTQGGAQIIANQPYLTGVSGAMGAINTPAQAKSFFDQTAGSIVPNFVRDYATSTDPLQRQTSVASPVTSAKNAITNGIPGLREHNQPQLDVMGNELKRNNGLLNAALNPLNPQTSTPTALTNAMGTVHNNTDVNGKNLTIPTQIAKKYTVTDATGKKIALTDAQRTQFIKQSGQAAQTELNTLINGSVFKNATPTQQSSMIDSVVSGQRDLAKQSFGNAGKLTSAGKAAKNNTLPSISGGKVTTGSSPSDYYKSPDAEYKALLASYNQKVKDNSYGSTASKLTASKELAKAKVGAAYDKSIRDAYNLSNGDLYSLVSTDPNGKAIVDKVLAYSQALKDAGITSTAKFKNKYGQTTIGSASVSKGSKGRATKIKSLKSGKAINLAAKGFKVKTAKAPSFKTKRAKLPSYAVKTPKVTVNKRALV